ncbi:serine hydrolase-like protein isoform X2 [Plutella xylostella]|uniref:serine hydrolase-like protein isoform X2 n=1 Tax=Plutella xylostella TaxID=51655 RepID=UPI002032EEA2|nr:serine hydrolase-like protein isoform X2 [Plutella xylostella]
MPNKPTKQWFLPAPWGKIALVSWGHPANPAVLMCHGFMDSAATFIPLLELLPDSYYYVAFDFPGAFYNAIYPNTINKIINLDISTALGSFLTASTTGAAELSSWYLYLYDEYYGNYKRYNTPDPRLVTYEEAVSSVARNRKVTKEQAAILLSRSLIPAGDGKFHYSWDPKMKKITNITLSRETLTHIFTRHTPPTLNVTSSELKPEDPFTQFSVDMMRVIQETAANHETVFVKGGHDLHVTNAREVAPYVVEFLDRPFNACLSKL